MPYEREYRSRRRGARPTRPPFPRGGRPGPEPWREQEEWRGLVEWGERSGPGAYGGEYEAPYGGEYEAPYGDVFHGYGMGYTGGLLRSRGSYQAGQLRSGRNPVDEFEFEWGDGYVGGRGYGGTNYDYEHGYQVGGVGRWRMEVERPEPGAGQQTSPATRGGYQWGEYARAGEMFGPARYGYGPYHHRLRRRQRDDDEIRTDVEEALFYDTWVDADRINVTVRDGVVTLSGTLPSYEEVRYANDDVWDIDGVRGVLSELEVDESLAEASDVEARAGEERHGEPRDERMGERPGEELGPVIESEVLEMAEAEIGDLDATDEARSDEE